MKNTFTKTVGYRYFSLCCTDWNYIIYKFTRLILVLDIRPRLWLYIATFPPMFRICYKRPFYTKIYNSISFLTDWNSGCFTWCFCL